MQVDDLVAAGYITADAWVLPLRTQSGDVLTPRQALRVYGHAKRASLPDGLAELASEKFETRPVDVTPDEAYAYTAAMDRQWREHDVFPFDTQQNPQSYDAVTIPQVVKRGMDRVLLPFQTAEDLAELARRYNGEFDDITGDRDMRLREIRKQPVIRRLCQATGCNELVTMSLRAAIVSIEKYGLLPQAVLKDYGLDTAGYAYLASRTFRPHRLCTACADTRQANQQRAQRAQRSPGPRAPGQQTAINRVADLWAAKAAAKAAAVAAIAIEEGGA